MGAPSIEGLKFWPVCDNPSSQLGKYWPPMGSAVMINIRSENSKISDVGMFSVLREVPIQVFGWIKQTNKQIGWECSQRKVHSLHCQQLPWENRRVRSPNGGWTNGSQPALPATNPQYHKVLREVTQTLKWKDWCQIIETLWPHHQGWGHCNKCC